MSDAPDPAAAPDPARPQPVFVLVRPQLGENIGAAARAMWNFGLDRMRITGPRDGWPNPKAIAMASGAGRLLDQARILETTAEAVADCHAVYATTARERGMTKTVMTPEAALRDAARRTREGEKVAILFGPERSGLENDDVILAQTVVTVDVNPAFPSLNLAQCVLLCAYEWRRATHEARDETFEPGKTGLAAREDVGRMVEHLETELETAGFFYPEGKMPAMKANLRNLFQRAPWTDADVRTLRGLIRALAEGPRRKG